MSVHQYVSYPAQIGLYLPLGRVLFYFLALSGICRSHLRQSQASDILVCPHEKQNKPSG